jgi:PAS domain-containing protein
VLGVVATVVEVTAMREAQDAERRATREARAAGALIDAVFAAAPVGLAVWTPDLRYERVNDALAAMNALSPEEHVGRRLEDVLGDDAARVRPLIERVVATGEPVLDEEIPMRTDDGSATTRPATSRSWERVRTSRRSPRSSATSASAAAPSANGRGCSRTR